MNYTYAALKVALYFVQHQEPNWRIIVTTIVKQSNSSNPANGLATVS